MPEINFAEKLAKEGFSFQNYCAKAIAKVGWKVAEEYPFSHHQIPGSGCLDILAQFNDEKLNYVTYSMIACKKMDPSYESLVMYRSSSTCPDDDITPQYIITEPEPPKVTFPLLKGTEICDICKELIKDPTSNTIKMRSKNVKKIGNHLNHALVSITSDVNSATQKFLELGKIIPRLQVFAPVLVTGANLIIIDVADSLDNDPKLNLETTSKSASWCIFRFPVRKRHLISQIPTFVNPFKKLDIFMVNVRSIDSFFEKLKSVFFLP